MNIIVPNGIISKACRLTATVCLSASLGVAFAQGTVTLSQTDPQGYSWDAGNAAYGGVFLQLDQALSPNEAKEAFTWTPVSGGWTVCNKAVAICLSDNGSQVVMSAKADTFTITNQDAVLDVTTGRYIEQPASVANGAYLHTGTVPFAWTFAFSTPSTTSTAAGAATAGFYKIMPLGDSITEGYATSSTFVQGGYRCPLNSLLKNSGLQFTFVGDSQSLEPGIVTACPDVNWEGHGGYTIAGIQGWEDADGSIRSLQPNIILLLGGTNDVAQYQVGSVAGQLSALLSDIFARDPSAWVIVSTIPPINPHASAALAAETSWAPNVPLANSEIEATVSRYQRTTLIDFYSSVVGNVNAYIGSDGIHPTVLGYSVLANLWSNAIHSYVKAIN